ncbi:MAG TPA: asparagine synthase-related protein [Candidatus Saccharimonadales bacterium]|nr:asparagine synthase-related protein [Candidatus Saccharimonadales bacterium]
MRSAEPAHSIPLEGVADVWQRKDTPWAVRQFCYEQTSVLVVGECFATDEELSDSVRRAHNGDVQPVASWPGSYLTIVDQPTVRRVIGSLSGDICVYFITDERGDCWWSTAATPLAALRGASISYERLTLDFTVYGIARFAGATPFEGVRSVPPGFALELTAAGVSVGAWYIPSSSPSLVAGAPAFRTALLHSLASRLATQSVIAADFSGGLDSTALALLAARHTNVVGVTYYDDWIKGDDLRYAQNVAKGIPRLHHIVVKGGEHTLRYGDLADERPWTDLPSLDAPMTGFNRVRLETVGDGPSIYLNGIAGDSVLHAPITRIADLYIDGHKVRALHEASVEARRLTTSPWRMIKAVRTLAGTSYAEALSDLARLTRDPAYSVGMAHAPWNSMMWCRLTPGLTWLTMDTREVVGASLEMLARLSRDNVRPGDLHTTLSIHSATSTHRTANALALSYGLTEHMPYADTAVIRSAIAIPTYERATSALFKPLLEVAFGDILPPVLTRRPTKGDFSGMVLQGIRRNEVAITTLLKDSPLVQRGIMHRDIVLQEIRKAALGVPAPLAAIGWVVAIALWLRHLDLRKATWWNEM